ncbi:MAG: tetratricopeptide repeat protein [Phenylobacterium sp.]|nr:tetratricopeptide repeat protein [Phenylobacterium sp.]
MEVGAGRPGALRKLADAGNADAQVTIGTLQIFGMAGFARDGRKGCAYIERASATRADALHLLAECYQHGYAGRPDPEMAKLTFARAADMGYLKSKCALGNMLMAEGREATRGLQLCEDAANGGSPDAQADVGNVYLEGRLVPKDAAKAAHWYGLAVAQQQPQAARTLGMMRLNGEGVPQDESEGLRLLRLAIKFGDPHAATVIADRQFARVMGENFVVGDPARLNLIDETIGWYRVAISRDDRPEAQEAHKAKIAVLEGARKLAAGTAK